MGIITTIRNAIGRRSGGATVRTEDRIPWPPPEHAERVAWYALDELLYRGRHKRVFIDSGRFAFKATKRNYVGSNLCGALTNLLVSRGYGEGVALSGPDGETAIAEFLEWIDGPPNRIQRLLYEVARTVSYAGDAVVKVRYDADKRSVLAEEVHPTQWFPEFSVSDGSMVACTLGRRVTQGEQSYLWLERHDIRSDGQSWIAHEVYPLHGSDEYGWFYSASERVGLDAIPHTTGLPDEQPTGISSLLVIHFSNRQIGLDEFGMSDYEPVRELQGELNWRRTQRSGTLDQFVRPFVVGPPWFDSTDPTTGNKVDVDLDDIRYIENTSPDARIDVIEWSAELPAVEETIRDLTDQFAHTVGVDRAALLNESSGNVSGRALRLMQTRTQATVQEAQVMATPCIQQLISVMTQLALAPGVILDWKPTTGKLRAVDPSEVTVTWGDGLPSDRMEDITEHEKLLQMGVEPKSKAAEELFGLPQEEALALVQQADTENDAMAAVFGAPAVEQPAQNALLREEPVTL